MEAGDLPLVTPLRQLAFNMFADELNELRVIAAAASNARHASSPQRQTPADTSTSPAAQGAAAAEDTGKPGKAPAPATGGGKGKGKQAAAVAPPVAPVPTPPRTPPPELVSDALLADPYTHMISNLEHELTAHVEACQPFATFTDKRLAFFSSKPGGAETYLIEEVLCEWEEQPASIPAMCIDAVAMSRAHADAMAQRYSYVPPRGLHVAGHVRPEDVPEASRQPDLLTTHAACGAGMAKAAITTLFSARDVPAASINNKAGSTKKGSSMNKSGAGALNATQTSLGATISDVADEGSMRLTKVPSVPAPTIKTVSPQTKRLQSVRGAGVPDMIVETSLPALNYFNCSPGTQYELRCRIYNRDTCARNFKLTIDGDRRKLVAFDVVTPGYNSETAVVPGQCFDVVVTYSPLDTESLDAVLRIGHARCVNRVDAESNKLSQWQFHDLSIHGTSVAPQLDFGSALLNSEFEPCFLGDQRVIRCTGRNTGSAGTLVFQSSDPALLVSTSGESMVSLSSGEAADVTFTFSPDGVRDLDGVVTVLGFLPSQDPQQDTPVSTQTLAFTGKTVIPDVSLESFCDADLTAAATANALPHVVVKDACVGFTSTGKARVVNRSQLPVALRWQVESVGPATVAMNPPALILGPNEAREFTMSLLPVAAGGAGGAVEALVSLMMENVPRAAAAVAARTHGVSTARPRLRPQATTTTSATDPFGIFSPRLVMRADSKDAPLPKTGHLDESCGDPDSDDLHRPNLHFCSAVRVVADPTPPSATVTPSVVINSAPCLIHQPNTRQLVVSNTSARDLHFWLDPPSGNDHPRELLAKQYPPDGYANDAVARGNAFAKLCQSTPLLLNQRFDVDVVFSPARFLVKGGQSKAVTLTFTAKRAGPINAQIEVYSPLIETVPIVTLSGNARGPELTLSTSILEYGVIPLAGEAEGRLTLTNNNPIPVVFSLLDTHATDAAMTVSFETGRARASPTQPQDTDRMVFLPAAGTLRPRESRDITVYVRGITEGPLVDKVRVAVEDGTSSFVQVRASVQRPRACVTPATLVLPRVERNVPTRATAYASNLSAVDMDYRIVPIDIPEGMKVAILNEQGMLHAGAADVPLDFDLTFSGLKPAIAVMGLESTSLDDPVVFELTCGVVQQLSVVIAVTTKSQPARRLPTDEFCERIVTSLVTNAFMAAEKRTPLDAVQATDPIIGVNFAPSLNLAGVIDCELPFAMEEAVVTITNRSGCYTRVTITPDKYPTPANLLDIESSPSVISGGFPAAGGGTKRAVDPVPSAMGRLAPLETTLTSNKGSVSAASTTAGRKGLNLALTSGAAGKTFTCKALNGAEAQENKQKAVLADAQQSLVHGAGFAIDVDCFDRPMSPFESIEVPVRILANIPGLYVDNLRVRIADMQETVIPVRYHVEGKAIVMDPFTSGLSVGPMGVATLLMPPLVSGMNSVKRTLTLTSRCPRELVVSAKVMQWGKIVGADVSDAFKLRIFGLAEPGASTADCPAVVSPTSFVLPALQTKAIVLEYAPPASSGADFHASLVIESTLAETPFNDKFLIDEFYKLNAHRFQAKRRLQAASMITKEGVVVRGVPKVMLRVPVVDRPGIVTHSAITVAPDDGLLSAERKAAALTPGNATKGAAHQRHPDDDSDDERESSSGAKDDAALIARMKAQRVKQRAVADERELLLTFIDQRRRELASAWQAFVRTLEVEMHVAHLHPKLVTDPPDALRLPMCRRNGGASNSRSIVLSNEGAAPIDFRLAITSGPFKVAKTLFRAENKGTAVDFALSKLAQSVRGRPSSRDSNPAQAAFRLRPSDVLEVAVELCDLGEAVRHDVEGTLQISFAEGSLPQDVPLLATVHVPVIDTDTPTVNFRPSVAVTGGRKQPVYRRMLRLINPSLCPARFTITHDPCDRPVSFSTTVAPKATVMKATMSSINSSLKPSAAAAASTNPATAAAGGVTRAPLRTVKPLGSIGGAAEANVVSVGWTDEADANPVDDPTRFIFETTQGVLEAASAGCAPSVLEIPVTFSEHALTFFQSRFRVEVEGGNGCVVTLIGESRDPELL